MADARIELDPGAQENGMACMVADLLEQNLAQNPGKAATFNRLRARVGLAARDAGVAMTLAFSGGRCLVTDGLATDCQLTIEADSEDILGLTTLKLRLGLPDVFDTSGRQLVKKLFGRQVKIAGLARHPLLLMRVARIFSVA